MSPEKPARFFAVGVNHKSGSAFLRDRLFIDEEMLPEFYGRLARQSINQAIVLSTCDRVEVQGASDDPEQSAARIREIFRTICAAEAGTLEQSVYAMFDDAAIQHIFSVAASLDSQVIGEPQVLGQVKEGHRHASAAGMVGPELDGIMQAAYVAAKRVRTETSIGERAVSIASAAVQIAGDLHGDIQECSILIVGLGEIGDLITRQLRVAGADRITLTGPGRRTEREAHVLGLHFLPFDNIQEGLARADITVSAVSLGRHLIDRNMVSQALTDRRRRPMLFLDGGLPADVQPDVHDLDGAFVYTLDDLEQVAQRGRSEREAVATEALVIIDQELTRWHAARNAREIVPTVVALRDQFNAIRQDVLDSRPGIDAEEATRLLINRLLHMPSRTLRNEAEDGSTTDQSEALVRRLFALDTGDTTESDE